MAHSSPTQVILDLVFPYACPHCETPCSPPLCRTCTELLSLATPQDRCRLCFSDRNLLSATLCRTCRSEPPLWNRLAQAFPHQGPAPSLISTYEKGSWHLAKGCAATLTAQLLTLGWPLPDLVIPAPTSRLTRWQQGYAPHTLLAKHVSQTVERPLSTSLKLAFTDPRLPPVATLKQEVADQTVLLIATRNQRPLLHAAAQALQEGLPAKIMVMTFC